MIDSEFEKWFESIVIQPQTAADDSPQRKSLLVFVKNIAQRSWKASRIAALRWALAQDIDELHHYIIESIERELERLNANQ